jgi:branched-chain amino acid transport system ATP-binding protein
MRGEATPILEVESVHSGYGRLMVLHGLSMAVRRGETVAVLGRNGAGKTTLVRTIMGIVRPWRGRILFAGRDISGQPPHRVARLGIGVVLQGHRIFPSLTVYENLTLLGRDGNEERRLDEILARFPNLRQRLNVRAGHLSGGERKMLALARALMMSPVLLILDEPSEGLSPAMVEQVRSLLSGLKKDGHTIMLVEQNLDLALALSDRVYVLAQGQVAYHSSTTEGTARESLEALLAL